MKTSQRGIDLIKRFEGLELKAYKCPAGVWTIGYGHTATARPGMEITEQRAEALLAQDLVKFEMAINKLVTVPITQGIYDALASFSYNVGVGAFGRSTLLRLLNRGLYAEALDQLLRWNMAGDKELPGLTARRQAERRLGYSQPFPKI